MYCDFMDLTEIISYQIVLHSKMSQEYGRSDGKELDWQIKIMIVEGGQREKERKKEEGAEAQNLALQG